MLVVCPTRAIACLPTSAEVVAETNSLGTG